MLAHRNMSDEKQILFLQRCLTNTERLQRLLTDVSLLTRMDDGSASILKEQVNLTDIINDVVEDRQIIAATKGIRIENFVSHNVIMAGNASLLEAVFNNLIDNAIVYSGGTRIKIELISIDNDKVVIALSDNGCGVPPEHLPRLFERFYRIDKGRSRAAGGTGLGLSIVKNAVILHGGEISAETQCSGGLLFKITFSRNSK
jgi:signal transduction histidine kinase